MPLFVRLAISFLTFSAVLLVILWLFQTVFLESFYKTVKTAQVKRCAYSIADYIEDDSLTTLVSDIEEQNKMPVSIYRISGDQIETIYATDNNENEPIDKQKGIMTEAVKKLYADAKASGGEIAVVENAKELRFQPGMPSEDNGKNRRQASSDEGPRNVMEKNQPYFDRVRVDSMEFAKIVTVDSGEYLVVVESEITPVNSVVDTLRIQLIIATAVIVVISIAIALLTARRIAKPIADTNEKAKALARQDYSVRFTEGRYKEVAELNDTLNYAADELGKVDELRRELIANISHDLRTPLTMITGYSEVMRDLPGEMTPENIQIIIDESNHLNALVSDLLDISRLESGTAELKMAPFSLTRCIQSIFARYTKLIEAEGFDIRFEYEGEVFVTGDELRITQVLYNLINNAINYTGEDKTVIVRQSVREDRVRIDVIDHGEGIPADQLEYIWDRYYRVDKEHKQAKIGTGLGLSIVKKILIAHDAVYGVESEPGCGSDFYFELPLIDTEEE